MPQAAGEKRNKKNLFSRACSSRLIILFVFSRQSTVCDLRAFLVFKSTLFHLTDITSDIKSTRIYSRLYYVLVYRDKVYLLKRGLPEKVRNLPPEDTGRIIFQNFVGTEPGTIDIIQDFSHYCYHVPSSESSKVMQKCNSF